MLRISVCAALVISAALSSTILVAHAAAQPGKPAHRIKPNSAGESAGTSVQSNHN